jgi:hypothetical protein
MQSSPMSSIPVMRPLRSRNRLPWSRLRRRARRRLLARPGRSAQQLAPGRAMGATDGSGIACRGIRELEARRGPHLRLVTFETGPRPALSPRAPT